MSISLARWSVPGRQEKLSEFIPWLNQLAFFATPFFLRDTRAADAPAPNGTAGRCGYPSCTCCRPRCCRCRRSRSAGPCSSPRRTPDRSVREDADLHGIVLAGVDLQATKGAGRAIVARPSETGDRFESRSGPRSRSPTCPDTGPARRTGSWTPSPDRTPPTSIRTARTTATGWTARACAGRRRRPRSDVP
jgi:hypothetical protein